MIRIAICDDSKLFLDYLEDLVLDHFLDLEEVSIKKLLPKDLGLFIEQQKFPYDIFITDIEMGDINGIDFVKEIYRMDSDCITIFISSYIDYFMDVYEVQHVYYLLKSELEGHITKALEKAYSIIKDRSKSYIKFSFKNVEYCIQMSDILYIEAIGRYIYINHKKQVYKFIYALKDIELELSEVFIRTHKSYIVNADYILSTSRTNCELTNGDNIPISNTYSKRFQEAYAKYVSQK